MLEVEVAGPGAGDPPCAISVSVSRAILAFVCFCGLASCLTIAVRPATIPWSSSTEDRPGVFGSPDCS